MTTPVVQFEKKPHIIDLQKESEAAFLAEFEAGGFTLQAPLVKLNPYLFSPLSAMVLFRTDHPAEVQVTVHGKEPAGDITHTFPAGYEHILTVNGLYAGTDNRVTLRLSTGDEADITITTDSLADGVPQATSCVTTPAYFGDNVMFLTASMRSKPVAYDYNGDIRWYCTENFSFDIKRIRNGHILVGTERLIKMPYYVTGLYEMTWNGKVYKEYRLPGGYHHDQFEMDNGDLLILTEDLSRGTVEDMCVLVDKDTGEIKKVWDYATVLPQHPVAGSGSQTEEDWFHNNAVWYDAPTNSLSFSGRHQDVVINIDYDSGALNWIIGDPEGWPQEYVDQYFFTPVGEPFDWQYEQHACRILPNGDVMLFDNGQYRAKNPENYIKNSQNFSRGVIYRIDTDNMTIEQVWQYGKERGADFFSPYICNCEYYGEGRYMVHSGGIGYFDGKPCDGLAAMMMMGPDGDKVELRSITVELVDDQVVYELTVPANCYRAEKMPLYYAGETTELGDGVILGTLNVTPEVKGKLPSTTTPLTADFEAQIIEEVDRVRFLGIFEEGDYAQFVLRGADGADHLYPILTVPEKFTAMCVGTFQKENPHQADVVVNKNGLSGAYEVLVFCEGTLYETGVTINC